MKLCWLSATLGLAACGGSLADHELGVAADRQAVAYSIAGVHASPGTVHFTGLPYLLNSAEGMGPLVVTTHVGGFVQPVLSTSVTGVDPDAVSHAVGYSLWARHDLLAVSSATFPPFESSRLEAYASFSQTCWEVTDASSGVELGSGASYEPCGVYFQTVNASHVALPDMSVFELAPVCALPVCVSPPCASAAGGGPPGFVPSENNPALSGGGAQH
jgi:hypothetical protein